MSEQRSTSLCTATRRTTPASIGIFVSAACPLVAGLTALVLDFTRPPSSTPRVTGGLLLVGSAILLVTASIAVRRRGMKTLVPRARCLLHGSVAGAIVCYICCLIVGPRDGVTWLYFGLVMLLFAILTSLAARVAPKHRFHPGRRRLLMNAARAAYAVLVLLFAAEMVMRVYSKVLGLPWTDSLIVQHLKPTPGGTFAGRRVNSQGFVDEEFSRAGEAGVYRVAVLGDELLLAGGEAENYVSMLERDFPNVEFYNFAIPKAGPREYLSVFLDEVSSYQPHLVLCCVSIGNDVTGQRPARSCFDWRTLCTCRLAVRTVGITKRAATEPATTGPVLAANKKDRSEFLRDAGLRMAVCRSPIRPQVREQWQESIQCLGKLANCCRSQDIAFGMVVVPGEFQVSKALQRTLQQRMGYRDGALDVQLPQRRLALFAKDKQVPVLDLLPHLHNCRAPVFERNSPLLSVDGSRAVADVLSQWVEQLYGERIAATTGQREYVAADTGITALR